MRMIKMQTTGTLDTINLNYNEQVGLKGIIGDLTRRYAFIKRIILYGSKARGDFTEDSDIDLLFVTDRENPRSVKFKIYDIIHKYEVDNDIVVSAISGISGIKPTYYSVSAGKYVALANKKSLVSAGEIITKKVKEKNRQVK